MRILIVEDIDARYAKIAEALRRPGGSERSIVRARTAAQAIEFLSMTPRFDVVLLDHDLDADESRPGVGTSADVVDAIEKIRISDPPPIVIVYSKNEIAGPVLVSRLAAVGWPAAWIPYPRPDRTVPTRSAQLQLIRLAVDGIEGVTP